MADTKKLLDLQGLALYDSKLKAGMAEEYVKKEDVVDPDLTPYAKKEDIDREYAKKTDIKDPDLSNLATKAELEQGLGKTYTKEELAREFGNYPTKQELATTLEDYPTKEEANDQFETLKQNLDNLDEFGASKEELNNAIAPLATKEELTSATTGLATKDEVTSGNSMLNNSITEVKGSVDSLGDRVDAIEGAGYMTKAEGVELAQQYNKEAIFVNELPEVEDAVAGVVYLVPKKDKKGNNTNYKDEFILDLAENRFEPVGDTMVEVDLSGYPTKDEMNTAIGQATGSIVIETISIEEINSLFANN